MAINTKKDLSKVVARSRFRIFESRYFVDAYLWKTRRDMSDMNVRATGDGYKTAPDPLSPDVLGLFCQAPYSIVVGKDGEDFEKHPPRLGELHFAKEDWNTEVSQHECQHAAIRVARAVRLNPAFVFGGGGELSAHFLHTPLFSLVSGNGLSDEELFCYISGDLFSRVHRWLWEVDPA